MDGVAEEQLKRVLAQGKVNCCFGLSRSEVQMIEVIRYRLIQRRQLGVDQKMVVPGVGLFDARRRHAHVGKTKVNGRLLPKHGSVMQADEINPGVRWRSSPGRGVDDTDLDARRKHRRRVRNVILVSKKQLKRVISGFQRYRGLGLAGAEVQVLEVVRNWLVERRQFGIDQQMVMP